MFRLFSELVHVNPKIDLSLDVNASTQVSFIPMSDVTETGNWIGHEERMLGKVRNGFTTFSNGDVLVAKITPCFENGKGAHVTGLKNGIGFGSTEFHVLRARDGVSPRFVYHVTQSEHFRRTAEAFMSGSAGQRRVPGEFFERYFVPDLSFQEQNVIAQVLDTLDVAIRKTDEIIEKLKQLKQGLLHDLLTRGVDASGELRPPQSQAPHLYKESPLGLVPNEWTVDLLDSVAARGSGHTPSKSVASYWNGGIKWVSLADSHRLDQIYITKTEKEISELGLANSSAVKHQAGTVILSRDAGVGKSAILAAEMAVSQHFIAWLCGQRLNSLYLYFMLQRMKPMFESIAIGSTIKTIGLAFFKKLKIVIPSRAEQDRIVEVILSNEAALQTHSEELAKLRLQKKGLMADLLTGRIHVTPLLATFEA